MPVCLRRALFCFCSLLIVSTGLAQADSGFFNLVRSRIEQQVRPNAQVEGFFCRGEPICGVQLIPPFYETRHFSPVWFDAKGLRPSARTLVTILETIDQEGLRPSDYHLDIIHQILNQLPSHPFPPGDESAVAWADLDLLLTDAFLLMAAHLSGGRINPETLHPDWIINQRSVDLLTILNTASSGAPMVEAINRLRPGHAEYLGLRQALAGLRQVEAGGGWPPVEGSETLHPQDADKTQVVALRQRLGIPTGAGAQYSSEDLAIYDQDLVNAVKAFQRSHGLTPDGVVGRKTRAAMNVGIKERIRQVELNLERWRWLPGDLGDRYIAVNTADFSLQVVENHQKLLSMRVVVGRPARQTPVFSAKMSYMVLNPYWNVPYTIAVEDILPRLTENPDYLTSQGIKVFSDWSETAVEMDPHRVNWNDYGRSNFPFRLRQDPGEKNALGRLKFIFPNKFAVYLHDTPQRALFSHVQRDFSSGCIRVENALQLADYLLTDAGNWTPEMLRATLAAGQRQVVRMVRPINVHLLYMTAWVDQEGVLQFRDDIYDRDRHLDAALMERNPYLPPGLTRSALEFAAPVN